MTLPTFDVAEAQKLRDDGHSFENISRVLGVSAHRVRVALVPGYRELRAKAIRLNKSGKSSARKGLHIESELRPSAETVRCAELQLSRRPPDTRGLTARLCGDPTFERSALGQRRDQ